MSPYLGYIATFVIALLLFYIARNYTARDKRQDKEVGSNKETLDEGRAAREKLAATLETERKEAARDAETDRRAEAAHVEEERKDTATVIKAEQGRLVARVDEVERGAQKEIGNVRAEVSVIRTGLAVLVERVSRWMRRDNGNS